MSMRNLTLLLLVFMLALMCIKHAKAGPVRDCIASVDNNPFVSITNHPEYGELRPFVTAPLYPSRVDDVCQCIQLAVVNGFRSEDILLECQAKTRLFELIDV